MIACAKGTRACSINNDGEVINAGTVRKSSIRPPLLLSTHHLPALGVVETLDQLYDGALAAAAAAH